MLSCASACLPIIGAGKRIAPAKRGFPWDKLPVELALLILRRLSYADLAALHAASRTLHRLCSNPALYVHLRLDAYAYADLTSAQLDWLLKRSDGRLVTLDVSHHDWISNAHLALISRSPYLRTLCLSYCTGLNADGLANLPGMATALEQVALEGILDANDDLMERLFQSCQKLKTVTLRRSYDVTHAGATHLLNLPRLQELSLAQCPNIDFDAIDYKFTAICLTSLDVSGSHRITGTGVRQIVRQCPNLTTLILSQCPNIDQDALYALTLKSSGSWRVLKMDGCTGINDMALFLLCSNLIRFRAEFQQIINAQDDAWRNWWRQLDSDARAFMPSVTSEKSRLDHDWNATSRSCLEELEVLSLNACTWITDVGMWALWHSLVNRVALETDECAGLTRRARQFRSLHA